MATKQQFLAAYRAELATRYEWARDAARLDKAMSTVAQTINSENWGWSNDGEAYFAALKACGLPKRVSMKALRALPAE
jgi:hypothetical protein